jgi:endonuclease III related protein
MLKYIEVNKTHNRKLLDIYTLLLECYGPQHWWPAGDPFEVMVGAILTQSAAWTNVEKAIVNLKNAGVLNPVALRVISFPELAGLIHACGYYNMKTRKLRALAEWFGLRFDDNLNTMKNTEINLLRQQLLEVYGVGEETADSILLYACEKPIFVIDAYTRRIVDRLGFRMRSCQYAAYQSFFMENLAQDVRLYNEYHALLVAQGKNYCRKEPRCEKCCLTEICIKIG